MRGDIIFGVVLGIVVAIGTVITVIATLNPRDKTPPIPQHEALTHMDYMVGGDRHFRLHKFCIDGYIWVSTSGGRPDLEQMLGQDGLPVVCETK